MKNFADVSTGKQGWAGRLALAGLAAALVCATLPAQGPQGPGGAGRGARRGQAFVQGQPQPLEQAGAGPAWGPGAGRGGRMGQGPGAGLGLGPGAGQGRGRGPAAAGRPVLGALLGGAVLRQLITPQAREALGLTDEQVKTIESAVFDVDRKTIEIQARMRLAQLDLEQALRAERRDRAQILAKVDAIGAAQNEIRRLHAERFLTILDALTPEQTAKVRQWLAGGMPPAPGGPVDEAPDAALSAGSENGF